MPDIPFMQFLRPDGERRPITIDMPQEICDLAQEFIAAGGSYTSEVLSTGEVSLAAEFTVDDGRQDIACCVCFNNQGIPQNVELLVRESHEFMRQVKS